MELISSHAASELRSELYIGVAPTFAQSWLLPRMVEFQRLYPSLNVKLRVKASRLDFQHEPVDIAIYYSDSEHPSFYHQRLFDEVLVPVCNPEYYDIHFSENGDSVSQFASMTFIHCTESLEASEPNHEWKIWLESQNNIELKSLDVMERTYLFNHSDMAMIAAQNSMGVAMARESLVQTSLANGELVAPFERVSAGRGYDLICLNGQQHRPKNAAFIEWLSTQLHH